MVHIRDVDMGPNLEPLFVGVGDNDVPCEQLSIETPIWARYLIDQVY